MLSLSVVTNAAAIAAQVEGMADQMPFATALALTRTAQEAQSSLKAHLSDHFTVRSGWVAGSIRYRPAKKGPSPVAYVGSVYEPMADQVEGGKKEGKGGGDVAVPLWARRNKGAATKPSSWPGKLAKRKQFFVAPFSRSPFGVGRAAQGGDQGIGVFQRIGRGKGKKHLRLWWTLRDSVEIKPRWPFGAEAAAVVRQEFADHFWAALESARATAKPKRMGSNHMAEKRASIAAGMAYAFAHGAGR